MRGIYKPTGKAREFGDLAINLYTGCTHGCWYCYAKSMPWVNKDKFDNPEKRKGVLVQLSKDAEKYAGSRIPIFLCFTCDPYQPNINLSTRTALEILSKNGCAVNILTKGGTRACRDFDLLGMDSDSWFGTTLTYFISDESKRAEPRAALPGDRINAIKEAHRLGINTWVSLEPIISRIGAIELIRETLPYVDLYKIGKMNHCNGISGLEIKEFLSEAIGILSQNNKDYYIKLDTRPYLNIEQ